MSVSVELQELQEQVSEYGPVAFLTTVGQDGRPHVVSVGVELTEGSLVAGAGRTTATNISAHPAVTMLWPARSGGDYCLIVDGTGLLRGSGAGQQVVVTPSRAVLHRLAGAPGTGPSCVTILERQ